MLVEGLIRGFASTYVLGWLATLLPVAILPLGYQVYEKVSEQIQQIQAPRQVSFPWLLMVLVAFLLLLLGFILGYWLHLRRTKKPYRFFGAGGMFWKFTVSSEIILDKPFCPAHRLEMVYGDDSFCCPKCDQKLKAPYGTNDEIMYNLRSKAHSLATAWKHQH